MSQTANSDPAAPRRDRPPFQVNGWAVLAMLVVLVAGVVWQYVHVRGLESETRRLRQALVAARLETTLAAAVDETQQDRFEPGRQRASAFFTGLQQRLAPTLRGDASAAARELLARRDVTVTALARGDQRSTTTLRELMATYRSLVATAGLDTAFAAPAAATEGATVAAPAAPAAR